MAQALVGTRRNQEKVYDWIDRRGLTRPLPELSTRLPGSVLAPVKQALSNANVRWSVVLIFLFLWAEAGAVTFLAVQLTQHGMGFAEAAFLSGVSGLTGWLGQVVWGTWSDHAGRKFAIRFLVIGWALTLLAMIFITSAATAWVILLAWGLFRNAPFPVTYALLIDSVPRPWGGTRRRPATRNDRPDVGALTVHRSSPASPHSSMDQRRRCRCGRSSGSPYAPWTWPATAVRTRPTAMPGLAA
ncbi:MFS transporter [Nonomuraea sp. NPDC050451]|uniref:MFS transporter n=1 Tax=Nonomuraea sp. NPDC050451 TaxID=3364364 RepID=UPI0037BCB4C2